MYPAPPVTNTFTRWLSLRAQIIARLLRAVQLPGETCCVAATAVRSRAYYEARANCGLIESEADARDCMRDEREGKESWTAAERAALRKLIRMALIMLLAIVVAGAIAALLSSALGTV